MKTHVFYLSIVVLILSSCTLGFDRGPKRYIKSLQISNNRRVDWYVFGSMAGTGPSYLQVSNDTTSWFFTSFHMADIKLKHDSLMISLFGPEYEVTDDFKYLTVFVDTLGGAWNNAEHRIERLNRRNIDIYKPHFVDVVCPKPGCE